MGKPKQISDLQSQNKEFDAYIKAATENLKKRAEPELQKFNEEVDSFYTPRGWDQNPMAGGSYIHYSQANDFSLNSINLSLQAIANSVFSGALAPDGTTIDKIEKTAIIIGLIAQYEGLALIAAQSFIANILGVFDTSISTDYHSIISSKTLCPGLMLHVLNFGDSFHQQDYFNDQFIIENGINFKLIYSFSQAGMEQDIDYMNKHFKAIQEQESILETMQIELNKHLVDPDYSMEKIEDYQKRIKFATDVLEQYRKEVDDTIKKHGRKP